jgi:hypothetical protein
MKQDSKPEADLNNQCDFDKNAVVKICIGEIDAVTIPNTISGKSKHKMMMNNENNLQFCIQL